MDVYCNFNATLCDNIYIYIPLHIYILYIYIYYFAKICISVIIISRSPPCLLFTWEKIKCVYIVQGH